jgi:hypothetical protein
MSIWNDIYNNINNNIKLVGLFIGCSMKCYTELTEENNQQYPCFLNKFTGKKLIILVDPYLEDELKIEQYFITKGNPLVCTDKIINNNKLSIRIFLNDEVIVYALNESINYIKHGWIDNSDQIDTPKIYTIINLCLNQKIKFILQDFSGNDTTYFYSKLFKKYDRNKLLDYINLDVTQNQGGCRILLHPELVKLDNYGNFIQEKFMELSKIKESKLFNTILNNRIDILTYPIMFYYSQLKQNIKFEIDKIQLYHISLISNIYNINYDDESINNIYLEQKLEILINIILKDIIKGRELEDSLYEYIMSILHERKILYETMKILKFE